MRIIFAIREIINKFNKDDLAGYAAQSSYYIILSFFPFVALLLSLIRYLPIDHSALTDIIQDITPVYFHDSILTIFEDMYNSSTATLTSISAIGTLWAAGRGFMSLMKGFNAILEIEENRNFIVRRAIACVQTFFFIVIILAMLIFVVFGNKLLNFSARFFPYIALVIQSILDIKWIFFPAVLTLFFMFMFKWIPSRRESLIRQFPGALVSAIGWYSFSIIYSFYINHNAYTTMFGGLATLILALIWVYACMLIVFFGAEFNTLLEKRIISARIIRRSIHR